MKKKNEAPVTEENSLETYHEKFQDYTGKYDITFNKVKSSNIQGIAREHWGKVKERLWVHFKNDSIYYYYVPTGTFEKMMKAESLGKFLNQEIIPNSMAFKLRDAQPKK